MILEMPSVRVSRKEVLVRRPERQGSEVERVREARARRDAAAATAALNEVELAARSGENLMPRIIAAVEAYATLGEIADAMRRVFGEYSEAI